MDHGELKEQIEGTLDDLEDGDGGVILFHIDREEDIIGTVVRGVTHADVLCVLYTFLSGFNISTEELTDVIRAVDENETPGLAKGLAYRNGDEPESDN